MRNSLKILIAVSVLIIGTAGPQINVSNSAVPGIPNTQATAEQQNATLASIETEQIATNRLTPATSTPTKPTVSVPVAKAEKPLTEKVTKPVKLIIPSIKLNSPIVEVGLNDVGQMDVPSGKTNNVGWYKYGTMPGNIGTAVLDAHVFAAFKNLKNVKVGDSIYVQEQDGSRLRFVVKEIAVYPLSKVPREKLFNKKNGQFLNLITCAGQFTSKGATYTHRLIVYAELAG